MRNRLAHDTEQRRIAKRCWLGGMPLKEIATTIEVAADTIRGWRYEESWPPRNQYKDRPVLNPRKTRTPRRIKSALLLLPSIWRCGQCQGRCDSPDGHPRCRPEAAA